MEKNSFALCSNYFNRLRRKTREIDGGIERLTETWRTPHLLIGGYAERTAETNACLEELWESVRSTGSLSEKRRKYATCWIKLIKKLKQLALRRPNDAVEKLQLELKPSLDETDQLLKKSQAMYEDLKEQCNNLEIVLTEYGYHYEESNDGSENHSRNDNEDYINDSLLTTEEMPDVEIEFTPNLTWKCKAKSKDSDSFNAKNSIIRGISTPVIKSLESALQSEIFNGKGLSVSDISAQESNSSKRITKVLRR